MLFNFVEINRNGSVKLNINLFKFITLVHVRN